MTFPSDRSAASRGAGSPAPQLEIAIDTREQLPYEFPDSRVVTLKSGDYSVVGRESEIAVERKTKADCYRSLGVQRERFEREVQRLSEMRYAAIVIEASERDFLIPPAHSDLAPKSAIRTLLGWSIRYGVHVHFAGNRELGRATTFALLELFDRYCRQGRLACA